MQPMFSLPVHQVETAKQKLFNYLWKAAILGMQSRTSSNASGSTGQRMVPIFRKKTGRMGIPPVTNALETEQLWYTATYWPGEKDTYSSSKIDSWEPNEGSASAHCCRAN